MFEGFANVWTPILPARELGKRPTQVELAGERLALFRDGKGGVGALLDRCPHRGVALSLGEVDGDGCLTCPFHGWAFRADGACARVPLNEVSEEKRARHAATAVPVREVGGLIWVFTGLDAAGTEPQPPPALLDPTSRLTIAHEVWNIHWTRAMENMLDFPHVPFIHRRSFGRAMRKQLRPDSVMRMSLQPEPTGAWIQASLDGQPTGAGGLRWWRPNGMELVGVPGVQFHIYCVPLDARRTRMLHVGARRSLTGLLDWLVIFLNKRILLEDRAIVESSQPAEVPPAAEEPSVATDAPTLHFRRYYERELRSSSASSAKVVPASRLAVKRTAAAEGSAGAAADAAPAGAPLTVE